MFPVWTLGLLLACYLIGSIPSGLIVSRRMRGVDLRRYGSGNIGATNAFRALGLTGGLLVLTMDALKGFLAVHLAMFALVPGFLMPFVKVLFGATAIAGHNWSLFLGFKGGKGIATTLGVLLAIAPEVAAMAALLWVGIVALTRYSSLASLAAAVAVPILMIVYEEHPVYIGFGVLAAAFAIYKHLGNIQRLLKGEELALVLKRDEE